MQNFKLKPMIIAFIVTIIVVVTGGFTYQYVAQQKPLENQLKQAQFSEVTLPIVEDGDRVFIEIAPLPNVTLEEAVHEIELIMSQHSYKSNLVTISLTKQEQRELDSLWDTQLFNVAEVMSLQQYSKLPSLMNSLEQQNIGFEANATIDDNYVYITIRKDMQVKHILLPIHNQEMEVWRNA
ncbi:MAG TPA: hypothetical protein IAA29_17375 [Candidatus Paenibacillus intestinavium]|nr:hypothetical protein [Candidatus Paenibacillus intestinavium]